MNDLNINLTKFVDLSLTGEETSVSYGLRVFDDYANTYSNLPSKEDISNLTPKKVFELAININDDDVTDMIDSAKDNLKGVHICDIFYSWEELDVMVSKEENG